MKKLIADIRAAAHKERQINREATELQKLALELCAKIEKENSYNFMAEALNSGDGAYRP